MFSATKVVFFGRVEGFNATDKASSKKLVRVSKNSAPLLVQVARVLRWAEKFAGASLQNFVAPDQPIRPVLTLVI